MGFHEGSGHSQPSGGEAGDLAAEAQAYLAEVSAVSLGEDALSAGAEQPVASKGPGVIRRVGSRVVETAFAALDFAVDRGFGLASHPSGSDHFQGERIHHWQVSRSPGSQWVGYTKKNLGNTLGR